VGGLSSLVSVWRFCVGVGGKHFCMWHYDGCDCVGGCGYGLNFYGGLLH
jgi:hypothetical protein